ncbi:MAG TPA: MFS transporter, partial [Ktedonobacterales bacterium]|nr:MFS transporter [Ktedonobacterales bacterium]
CVSTLGGNLLEVVLLLFLIRDLRLAPTLIGLIWGVGGATSFGGALLARWALRRWGTGRTLVACQWIAKAFTFLIPVAGGPLWLAVALLAAQQLGDAAYAIYDITQTSVLQATIPAGLLGRFYATLNVANGISTLLGLALGAALGQTIGLRPTLFVAAGLMLVGPLLITCSPARRLS